MQKDCESATDGGTIHTVSPSKLDDPGIHQTTASRRLKDCRAITVQSQDLYDAGCMLLVAGVRVTVLDVALGTPCKYAACFRTRFIGIDKDVLAFYTRTSSVQLRDVPGRHHRLYQTGRSGYGLPAAIEPSRSCLPSSYCCQSQ